MKENSGPMRALALRRSLHLEIRVVDKHLQPATLTLSLLLPLIQVLREQFTHRVRRLEHSGKHPFGEQRTQPHLYAFLTALRAQEARAHALIKPLSSQMVKESSARRAVEKRLRSG
jgi:hypothetical protein